MHYNYYEQPKRGIGNFAILAIASLFALMSTFGMFMPASAADTTVEVSGDTATAENEEGWLFNRDTNTSTPYEFTTDESSIGEGSLYVPPISGDNPSDKFIAEYFMLSPMDEVETISYDFLVGDSGDEANDANEFYMNVYANLDGGTQYGDCVYNVVPDSADGWTTVTFDPAEEYDVTTRSSASETCPDSPSDMPEEASLRAFALNVGDTSDSDEGLDGYYDNVIVATNDDETTFDFEVDTTKPTVTFIDPENGDTVSSFLLDAEVYDENLNFFNVNVNKVGDADWNFTSQKIFANNDTETLENFDAYDAAYYGTCDGESCLSEVDQELPDGEYTIRINAYDDEGNRTIEAIRVTLNQTPDTKDECKKGGWEAFTQPEFRNQGDCVSWIASEKQQTDNPDAHRGRR